MMKSEAAAHKRFWATAEKEKEKQKNVDKGKARKSLSRTTSLRGTQASELALATDTFSLAR